MKENTANISDKKIPASVTDVTLVANRTAGWTNVNILSPHSVLTQSSVCTILPHLFLQSFETLSPVPPPVHTAPHSDTTNFSNLRFKFSTRLLIKKKIYPYWFIFFPLDLISVVVQESLWLSEFPSVKIATSDLIIVFSSGRWNSLEVPARSCVVMEQ